MRMFNIPYLRRLWPAYAGLGICCLAIALGAILPISECLQGLLIGVGVMIFMGSCFIALAFSETSRK